MSAYLEEAAELLRKASADAQKSYVSGYKLGEARERIAGQFATLAAIDKGLLPAELVDVVLDAIRKAGGR